MGTYVGQPERETADHWQEGPGAPQESQESQASRWRRQVKHKPLLEGTGRTLLSTRGELWVWVDRIPCQPTLGVDLIPCKTDTCFSRSPTAQQPKRSATRRVFRRFSASRRPVRCMPRRTSPAAAITLQKLEMKRKEKKRSSASWTPAFHSLHNPPPAAAVFSMTSISQTTTRARRLSS